MKKSTLKALAKIETGLVKRLQALRGRVDHLETVIDGLRRELETERRERIRQIDFVTQILGPLVADLEHRALDGDSETRAAYDEIGESIEAEEGRTFGAPPEPPQPRGILRSYTPEGLVHALQEGME